MATHVVNHWVSVHGPGLIGNGPFGGPPSYPVVDPDADVETTDGFLKITIKPRITQMGVLVEKVVQFPPGAWTHVVVSRNTHEVEE